MDLVAALIDAQDVPDESKDGKGTTIQGSKPKRPDRVRREDRDDRASRVEGEQVPSPTRAPGMAVELA
jgi:hypothetical protein